MTAVQNENPQDSKNVKTVKNLYKALKSADIETLNSITVDLPVWDVSPGFPEGKVYYGLSEILGVFYKNLRQGLHQFSALTDRFIDGENSVVVLGHYQVKQSESSPLKQVRFSHTWDIDKKGKILGVWQVADSAQFSSLN